MREKLQTGYSRAAQEMIVYKQAVLTVAYNTHDKNAKWRSNACIITISPGRTFSRTYLERTGSAQCRMKGEV